MIRTVTPQIKNGGLPMMACLSVIIHLVVYFFLLEFHFPTRFKETPVYYVDILNLPVANPQAGATSAGGAPATRTSVRTRGSAGTGGFPAASQPPGAGRPTCRHHAACLRTTAANCPTRGWGAPRSWSAAGLGARGRAAALAQHQNSSHRREKQSRRAAVRVFHEP